MYDILSAFHLENVKIFSNVRCFYHLSTNPTNLNNRDLFQVYLTNCILTFNECVVKLTGPLY